MLLQETSIEAEKQFSYCGSSIVRTLREDQPLNLLLNWLFYQFNRSEPTYKSQRIKLLYVVIAVCNQLNVNSLN